MQLSLMDDLIRAWELSPVPRLPRGWIILICAIGAWVVVGGAGFIIFQLVSLLT